MAIIKKFLMLNDGRTVYTTDYITAKTKDLIESGYTDLTEVTVLKQLEKILSGEKLSVIGKLMEDDIKRSVGVK